MRTSNLFALAVSAICMAAAASIPNPVEPRSPIMGGSLVKPGAVPFMVSVRDSEGSPICGGSLLSPNAVLTAKHCFSEELNLWNLSVLAGTNDKHGKGVVRKVARILVYPGRLNVDAIILTFKDAIPLGNSIQYAKLGTVPAVDDTVYTVGWGQNGLRNGIPTYPSLLMEVSSKVMKPTACEAFREEYKREGQFGHDFINNAQVFCTIAKGGKRGACVGDSGGPLINRQGELVGIVSVGRTQKLCQEEDSPRMYTDVDSLRPWILKSITPKA